MKTIVKLFHRNNHSFKDYKHFIHVEVFEVIYNGNSSVEIELESVTVSQLYLRIEHKIGDVKQNIVFNAHTENVINKAIDSSQFDRSNCLDQFAIY